jgi:hypothetical protein
MIQQVHKVLTVAVMGLLLFLLFVMIHNKIIQLFRDDQSPKSRQARQYNDTR